MTRRSFSKFSVSAHLARLAVSVPLAASALLASAVTAQAITFQFDYSFDSNGFFSDPLRRNALESAADFWEARLTDDLLAIESGPSGFGFNNTWTTNVFNPSDPDDDSIKIKILDLFVPADTLIVYAGGKDFSGSTLGVGGPGGFSSSGTAEFNDIVAFRGETGADSPTPTDFGPWGGAISFDTSTNWNFDVNNDPAAGQSDFQSVALHELAHVLGIGTSDSWANFVDPTAPNAATFSGPASQAVFGGPIPLALDPDGTNEFSHWAEGTPSFLPGTMTAQEALMDPTITIGTRKFATDLDFAGLDDVGWDVTAATPVPAPSLLLGALGMGAKMLSKRRKLRQATSA